MSRSAHRIGLAQSLSLLGYAVDGHVLTRLREAGLGGLRVGHGYVVQRLVEGPSTVGEIAASLGVTQQAVSKTVRELVDLGYVEQTVDAADRRRRPVTLTRRGRRAVEVGRRARAELEERVRDAAGVRRFATALAVLGTALDELGLADAVERRTVAPPEESS